MLELWRGVCREGLDSCAQHGTGWIYMPEKEQQKSIENMACQLKSVQEVSTLWEAHYLTHSEDYAAVAYMRPDVQYLSDFPVHVIPDIKVRPRPVAACVCF